MKVVTTTIEKRFQFSSFQSGIINSAFDIGTLLMMIPVTYIGGKSQSHKPRWIGTGLILVGLGGLLWTVPHFASPQYQDQNSMSDQNNFLGVFIVAQVLVGIGACSIVALGVSFIDDNVDRKSSPLYIAIFQCGTILGPALGKKNKLMF